jgi:phage terminase small subunit
VLAKSLAHNCAMPRRPRAEIEIAAALPAERLRLVEPPALADLPEPPAHLSEFMRSWWVEVVREYALEPHHLRLLEAACDAFDRMTAARTLLLKEGLTVSTRTGCKAHPAVVIERDSRAAFMVALRELDLDCPAPAAAPYMPPPAIRSNRRR